MEYVVVAFRSRAHTVKFSEILKRNGLPNEIINTPKEAGVGCGLSVKVAKERFYAVKNLTFSVGLNSFAGFFLVSVKEGRRIVRSI
ncbi:MAG: DUF3343 domain-containing protein [Clostridiales bacterium]|nr:DUF3343 domain-containing protein [Clostridiales bacterium]MBQ3046651.1 DUF3343 domain-containing protein [Clostridia bacterium]